MSRTAAIENEYKNKDNMSLGNGYYNDEVLARYSLDMYKSEAGDNCIRIVPPPTPDVYFGYKIWVHYDIGVMHDSYVCPVHMGVRGATCPICERREQLRQMEANEEILRHLSARPRYLFYVVDRTSKKTEEKGPQLYEAPRYINDEILNHSKIRRTGEVIDISDPDDGYVIYFSKTGKGLKTTYSGFQLEKDEPVPDRWLDVPAFEELLKYAAAEDMLTSLGTMATEEPPRRPERAEREERRVRREIPEHSRRSDDRDVEEREPRRRAAPEEPAEAAEQPIRGQTDEEQPDEPPRRRAPEAPAEEAPRQRRRPVRDEADEPEVSASEELLEKVRASARERRRQ